MTKPVSLLGGTAIFSQFSGGIQKDDYHIVTLQNDTGGWFFKIYKGSKPFINQNHIPSIQEAKAFNDSMQAANVGNLMKYKLENGIFPPSISVQELDSLKIIY